MTTLPPITQRVAGTLLQANGRSAIILRALKPETETEPLVYLRYALVTRGPEEHIFPAFLLDDWGKEIRGLKLYRWIREYGERFPRGEIFGYEQDGSETQCFLRGLELYARLPCYAYLDGAQPVETGVLLSDILLPQADVSTPRLIKRPADLKRPLAAARVKWWAAPTGNTSFDLAQLDQSPHPENN